VKSSEAVHVISFAVILSLQPTVVEVIFQWYGWQCGQGSTEDQLSPEYVSALGGMKVSEVSAGLWHTVFITQEGDVYSTGGNQFGQLGNLGDQAEVKESS
jgi:alpha-tubulin suppressor-like RCC1 family protein